jgi:hypothetical protein
MLSPIDRPVEGDGSATDGEPDWDTLIAKIPGSDAGYRLLTRVLPLGRGVLVEREGTVFVR